MSLGGLSFQPFAARLAAQGFSGRAAMTTLREMGFSFGDRVFWREWREDVGYEKGSYRASRQPTDRPPPDDLIIHSAKYTAAEYTYRYAVRVWDSEKQESRLEARHVALQTPVTISEAKGMLQDMIQSSETRSGGVTEVLEFSGAFVFDPTIE